MRVPERQRIVTIAGHSGQELPPEIEIPHLLVVVLRSVARVVVAWRPCVQWNIELNPPPGDGGPADYFTNTLKLASDANRLGDLKPAIHNADLIAPAHQASRIAA